MGSRRSLMCFEPCGCGTFSKKLNLSQLLLREEPQANGVLGWWALERMLCSSPRVTFSLNKGFTSPLFSRSHHDSSHSLQVMRCFSSCEKRFQPQNLLLGEQLLNGIQRAIHAGICTCTWGLQIPSLVFPVRQHNAEPCHQPHE